MVVPLPGAGCCRRALRAGVGRPAQSHLALTTDDDTLHAVAIGKLSIADAVESGDLRLDGDPQAIAGLTGLIQALTSSP